MGVWAQFKNPLRPLRLCGSPFFSARTLEALRLDAALAEWREVGAYDDESIARIALFEAVELEVRRLFPPAME